jgi:hypothetical protein
MPSYQPTIGKNGGIFFMSPQTTQQKWIAASVALHDAYPDFILSRQAMQCTPATLFFYKHTAGVFVSWLDERGITGPTEASARHVARVARRIDGLRESR